MSRPCDPDPQPVATVRVDAAEEQSWNDRQLAAPVQGPAARLWHYTRPAVVLGRSQRALLNTLGAGVVPIVQRLAGGGAVLVGPWMLGASVVLPLGHPLLQGSSIADSYRWLANVFVAAFARHGLAAAAVPPERTRKAAKGLEWACFAGLSAWEVTVDDRKLVGFAQRRSRHGVLLVAGALLSHVPWHGLCTVMRRPAGQAQELAANTVDAAALLGLPLPAAALAGTLAPGLAQAFAG